MGTRSKKIFSLLIGSAIFNLDLVCLLPAHSSPNGVLSPAEKQVLYKYFLCQPLSEPVPSRNDVLSCTEKIKTTWESSWLPAVRAKQQYLIYRQNTGAVLQWVGVSGGAAAATLGIANPKSSGTTAIVIGSASVLTAITGIIWKQESSAKRIEKCTDVISKQYKIQSALEMWNLQANNVDFRKNFLTTIKNEFIEYIVPGLEGCMPGELIYQS